ncbi:MAG: hypothetical protein AAF363_19915 [Bacteroidota bacterium]
MYWIVIEDDPKPDKYIPILVRSQVSVIELEAKFSKVKVFDNEAGALEFADQLKVIYAVESVRLFYPEGISKKLT